MPDLKKVNTTSNLSMNRYDSWGRIPEEANSLRFLCECRWEKYFKEFL